MNDHALTLFTVVKLHQIVLLQWKELTMTFVCHSITLINMVYQNIFFFLLTHGHYTPASFCTDNHRFIIILLFLYKKTDVPCTQKTSFAEPTESVLFSSDTLRVRSSFTLQLCCKTVVFVKKLPNQ